MEVHLLLVLVAIAQYLVLAYNFWRSSVKCAKILYRGGLAASALTAALVATLAWAGVRPVGPYFLIVSVGLGAAAGMMYAAVREPGDGVQQVLNKLKTELYALGGAIALTLLVLMLKVFSRTEGSLGAKLAKEFELSREATATQETQVSPPVAPRRSVPVSVQAQEPTRRSTFVIPPDFDQRVGLVESTPPAAQPAPVAQPAPATMPAYTSEFGLPADFDQRVGELVEPVTVASAATGAYQAARQVVGNLMSNPANPFERVMKAARRTPLAQSMARIAAEDAYEDDSPPATTTTDSAYSTSADDADVFYDALDNNEPTPAPVAPAPRKPRSPPAPAPRRSRAASMSALG
jgi:hypothetical protein